jgi:homoserine dehydrogenase
MSQSRNIEAFDQSTAEVAREVNGPGLRLRQVARVSQIDHEFVASVTFEAVGTDSPFYSIDGEWNASSVKLASGETRVLRGRGAGRWPTTESVMADIFELKRRREIEDRCMADKSALAAAS